MPNYKLKFQTKYCKLYEKSKGDFLLKVGRKTFKKNDEVRILKKNIKGKVIHVMIRNELAREIIPEILVYFKFGKDDMAGHQEWFKPKDLQTIRQK